MCGGTISSAAMASIGNRSIPACAGEPCNPVGSGSDGNRSIPACAGEPRCPHAVCPPIDGLSPRVRGNRRPVLGLHRDYGSIPACAGEPFIVDSRIRYSRSIPACAGEPITRHFAYPLSTGSIPACAGEPAAGVYVILPQTRPGSIPACAGEPNIDFLPRDP